VWCAGGVLVFPPRRRVQWRVRCPLTTPGPAVQSSPADPRSLTDAERTARRQALLARLAANGRAAAERREAWEREQVEADPTGRRLNRAARQLRAGKRANYWAAAQLADEGRAHRPWRERSIRPRAVPAARRPCCIGRPHGRRRREGSSRPRASRAGPGGSGDGPSDGGDEGNPDPLALAEASTELAREALELAAQHTAERPSTYRAPAVVRVDAGTLTRIAQALDGPSDPLDVTAARLDVEYLIGRAQEAAL
jgi:hypothetical protein